MGKGDKKTAKGKRVMGSYGNSRRKKTTTAIVKPSVKQEKDKEAKPVKKTVAKKAATPKATTEKKPAVKKASTTTKKTTKKSEE
jgi:ribosomal small subunit protein bTHX